MYQGRNQNKQAAKVRAALLFREQDPESLRQVKNYYLTRMCAACNIGQVMEKIVEQGLLYDFYGALLTGHQQEIYEKVVYDNLSLSEIAELEGISKQAVHDLVRRVTVLMLGYEEKLGMIRRFERIRGDADSLEAIARTDRLRDTAEADELISLAGKIRRDLEI